MSTLPLGTQPPDKCYAFAWYNQSLYLATSNGLLRSNDTGKTWLDINIPDANGSVTDVVNFSSGTALIAAVGGHGIYSMDNSGKWKKVENSPANNVTDLDCSNNTIYALVGTNFYSGDASSMLPL